MAGTEQRAVPSPAGAPSCPRGCWAHVLTWQRLTKPASPITFLTLFQSGVFPAPTFSFKRMHAAVQASKTAVGGLLYAFNSVTAALVRKGCILHQGKLEIFLLLLSSSTLPAEILDLLCIVDY